MEKHHRKKEEGQRGAIIVEATISLTIFMFAMFTLLFIIQAAYTQSRMSVALTMATKELAEYTHIYYATKLNEIYDREDGKSSELAQQVGEFIENVGGHVGSIDSELGQFVDEAGSALSATSLTKLAKGGLGQLLVMQMMKKNLSDGGRDNADSFMRRNHVSDLDLMESSFLEDGNEVAMRVKYRIQVVQLLNIDVSFQMSCWAYTTAWGQ